MLNLRTTSWELTWDNPNSQGDAHL